MKIKIPSLPLFGGSETRVFMYVCNECNIMSIRGGYSGTQSAYICKVCNAIRIHSYIVVDGAALYKESIS